MSNVRHIPIVGAGLAGLLAAHAWPNSPVYEASPCPSKSHAAVLRFRSEAASQLTGIPFKQVRVRKGIWFNGGFVPPDIQLANLYAAKVLGRIRGDRSIWNIASEARWIAPPDFYERMVEQVGSRIAFGTRIDFGGLDGRIVSTAPLGVVLNKIGISAPTRIGEAQPITVVRVNFTGVDAYQTIYFPGDTPMYRATLEGGTMICELAGIGYGPESMGVLDAVDMASCAFGIQGFGRTSLTLQDQQLGKIESLPDDERKALLFKLTSEYGIYSLGRFATWRNVLLDDVIDDIGVIKRLLATDRYGLRQRAAR